MSVRFAEVYFVQGGAPKHWRHRYEISNPPTAGRAHVAIIPGDKRSTLLCPFSLESYQVSNTSGELMSARDREVTPDRLAGLITGSWEKCIRLGFQRDFGVAALVLTELGQSVPKFMPPPTSPNATEAKRGGKPANEDALKPCNPRSKRGEVAAFFMHDEPQSLHEAMARLGLTRSGILSHLFTLNKDHGVGYELVSNCARLLVPEGFDLFDYKEPERKHAPRSEPAGDRPAPVKRTAGKPVNPEALCPIPEPSKRAAVARHFVQGFSEISSAMVRLGINRSAVLSHLFTINKENGLGYELSDDGAKARLIVPEGHVPFGPKPSRAKKQKQLEGDGGQA